MIKKKGINIKTYLLVDKLYAMKINYKWLLSATPFVNPMLNYNSYVNFLSNIDSFEKVIFKSKSNYIIKFCSNFIRRNTKKSIKSQIDIPIISEEIKYINQTALERNIYLDYERQNKIDKLFMLCTHILISDTDNTLFGNSDSIISLSQINKVMKLNFSNQLKNHKSKLAKETHSYDTYYKNYLLITNVKNELVKKYKFNDMLFIDNPYKLSKNNLNYIDEIIKKIHINNKNDLTIYHYNTNSYIICYLNSIYEDIKTLLKDIDIDTNIFIKELIINVNKYSSNFVTYMNSTRNVDDEIESRNIKYYMMYKIIEVCHKNYYSNIEKQKKNIKTEEYNITRCKNQIKLFENTSNFVSEAIKDPCSICFSDFENTFCMLKCRHVMCENCTNEIFKTHTAKCPFCRQINKKSEIKRVKIEEEKKEEKPIIKSDTQIKEEENIEKYGSKLYNLIKYLQKVFEDKENRVILFSQYDKMLKMVGSVLNDFNIKHIFMKGNVRVLNKNIEKFKTDDSYRVIMLSSETSASGNNLTEANHIIFIDVLNADKIKNKGIETQAIGRAVRLGQKKPVKIVRFITKNTIEESTYNANKYNLLEDEDE